MQHLVGEYSIVVKMDVSDLKASSDWYQNKLDLMPEPQFNSPDWRQFIFTDMPNVSIGLHENPEKSGSGGDAFTIVVKDIDSARMQLLSKGVDISEDTEVGCGVILAYFDDPDGNHLVIRQQH